MTLDSLRARYFDAQQDLASARSSQQRGEEKMAVLRDWADESGLSAELRELEHPTPPPPRAPVRLVRVRALESFCAPHAGWEYAPGAGQICDLPSDIVQQLILNRHVELVAPETPTTRPQWLG